jgi:hypothetical protein
MGNKAVEKSGDNAVDLGGNTKSRLRIWVFVVLLIVLVKGLFLDNGIGYKASGLYGLTISLISDLLLLAVPFSIALIFNRVRKTGNIFRKSLSFGLIVGFILFAILSHGGWYGHCRDTGNSISQCSLFM